MRAISKALNLTWREAKALLDVYSMDEAEVETSDAVWGRILSENGFEMVSVYCDRGCNLNEFCKSHPNGTYVVKLANHVVCASDGKFYDSWDSGKEVPLYVWREK